MCWWLGRVNLSFPTRESKTEGRLSQTKAPSSADPGKLHQVMAAEFLLHLSPLFVGSSFLFSGHSPDDTAVSVLMRITETKGPSWPFLMSVRIAPIDFGFCNFGLHWLLLRISIALEWGVKLYVFKSGRTQIHKFYSGASLAQNHNRLFPVLTWNKTKRIFPFNVIRNTKILSLQSHAFYIVPVRVSSGFLGRLATFWSFNVFIVSQHLSKCNLNSEHPVTINWACVLGENSFQLSIISFSPTLAFSVQKSLRFSDGLENRKWRCANQKLPFCFSNKN